MAEDYYTTLGVHRKASPDEIHKAYRDLARKYHPDLNPDDPHAEKKFEEIQAAFEVLSDQEQRAAYNRLDISFKTTRRTPSSFSDVPWTPPPRPWMKDRIGAKNVSLPAGLLVVHAAMRIYIEPVTIHLALASRDVDVGTQHQDTLLWAFVLFTLASAVLELAGAISMAALRGSTLAVAGALMAIFPANIVPVVPITSMSRWGFMGIPLGTWSLVVTISCCIGIPIGIWSLAVLRRPEVRDAFRS